MDNHLDRKLDCIFELLIITNLQINLLTGTDLNLNKRFKDCTNKYIDIMQELNNRG